MPYSESKDDVLASEWMETAEGRWLVAQLARYDGGPPKIGLLRVYRDKDGEQHHGKLGRIALEEWPRITAAVEKLLAGARNGAKG